MTAFIAMETPLIFTDLEILFPASRSAAAESIPWLIKLIMLGRLSIQKGEGWSPILNAQHAVGVLECTLGCPKP